MKRSFADNYVNHKSHELQAVNYFTGEHFQAICFYKELRNMEVFKGAITNS